MYTLLIVDDEYQARTGLRDLIDWTSMNISLVADASDGDEALPLIQSLKPDILLTDVRMHRMDGIELATKARQICPNIAVVFFSGYADAAYLKSALHIGAVDYIYKPVRPAELYAIMQGLVKRLDAKAQDARNQEEMRLLLERSKPLLAERFLRSWFHGLFSDEDSIQAKLDLLHLQFPATGDLFVAVFQPQWGSIPDNGRAENSQLLLESLIRHHLSDVLTCAEETGVIALLAAGHDEHSPYRENELQRIVKLCPTEAGVEVAVGLSPLHHHRLEVPEAVAQARMAIANMVFSGENPIHLWEEDAGEYHHANMPDMDLIERHLLAGDFQTLWKVIDQSFEEYSSDPAFTREWLISIAATAGLTLRRKHLPEPDVLGFCRVAVGTQTLHATKNALAELLKRACWTVQDERKHMYSAVTRAVMEIIHTRYQERLSVADIAEEVHYSSAHLSTLFRRETGTTLSEELVRTRLKHAMDHLRLTSDSVSSIAAASGYGDVQYFSRVFKQYTGMTPMEYRRKAVPC